MKQKKEFDNVDDYINGFPEFIRLRLTEIRRIILLGAPGAVESIAYGMPAYKLQGRPLVYFAGYPGHIGFYATPAGHEAFTSDLAGYKKGKGSVQFPNDKPLPAELISRMVHFRFDQEKQRGGSVTKKKSGQSKAQ